MTCQSVSYGFLDQKDFYCNEGIISVANIQNPFSVHLVKNELWAFSESLGPLLSIPPPVMTVAGL